MYTKHNTKELEPTLTGRTRIRSKIYRVDVKEGYRNTREKTLGKNTDHIAGAQAPNIFNLNPSIGSDGRPS